MILDLYCVICSSVFLYSSFELLYSLLISAISFIRLSIVAFSSVFVSYICVVLVSSYCLLSSRSFFSVCALTICSCSWVILWFCELMAFSASRRWSINFLLWARMISYFSSCSSLFLSSSSSSARNSLRIWSCSRMIGLLARASASSIYSSSLAIFSFFCFSSSFLVLTF